MSAVAGGLLQQLDQHSAQRYAAIRTFEWNSVLADVAREAVGEGTGYFVASICYSYWHNGLLDAVLVGPQHLKFAISDSMRQRQISAWQKGMLPKQQRKPPSDDLAPIHGKSADLLSQALSQSIVRGDRSLLYDFSKELHSAFYDWFSERLSALFRRGRETSLGNYDMSELKRVCAALQAVCAVYDWLLYQRGLRGDLLPNAYVMVRRRSELSSQLSCLSDVDPAKVQKVLRDLTFGVETKPIDLHYQTCVSLDSADTTLGVIPQFALSARYDENMMRVLARTDKALADSQSDSKEQQLIKELKAVPSADFKISGPFELPSSAGTNIDAVIADERHSCVVIAELKWIRKPIYPKERVRANKEFLKGHSEQLPKLRAFLRENPLYLKDRGILGRSVVEYSRVEYVLAGRDHLVWPDMEASDPTVIIDFDVLKAYLTSNSDLSMLLDLAHRYEWLPREGVDFVVRNETARISGITIESESFFSIA